MSFLCDPPDVNLSVLSLRCARTDEMEAQARPAPLFVSYGRWRRPMSTPPLSFSYGAPPRMRGRAVSVGASGFIGQPIMGLLTSHQVDACGVDLARGFRGINRRLRRLFIPRSARCAPKGG